VSDCPRLCGVVSLLLEIKILRMPLFSTACTTCHARIAVLREEAIGTILGCPKCGGMVLITPPEGWVSTHAAALANVGSGAALPQSGPPPLSKVSQTFLTLDLDPQETAGGWKKLLSHCVQSKVVWAWAAASVCVLGVLIWLWAASARTVEVAQAAVDPSKEVQKTASIAKIRLPEKIAKKTDPPAAAPLAPPAPEPPKPPEAKPIEAQVAETKPEKAKPPEIKAEPEPVAIKPIEAKPAEAKPVEAKVVEKDPLEVEPAAALAEPPQVAEVAAANPVLPSVPDLPPAVEIHPLAAEKPLPLPVNAARLVKQVAPPPIEVAARLDDIVPSFEMQDVPFAQALATVSAISTLPITLDADAMRRGNVSPRDPIAVKVKTSTVEKLLEEIASRRGMGVEIVKGQIVITAPAEQTETLRTVTYGVSDLCDERTPAVRLADLLQKFVSPDSWQFLDGRGSIKIDGESLKILQTGAVHREIAIFCEKLRLARGLATRSKRENDPLQLASAYAQAKPLLERRVSANYHEPTTLVQILNDLGSRAGADILIDRQALAAAGMSDKMEISYAIEKQPLETALDGLLRPLALGYRAIDGRTLQVAPQKELDRRLEWEFYPVGKQMGADRSGRELIARLKQSVAPSSWANHGLIYFDSPSQALLVSQSPTVQAALCRYLSEKSAKK
jgi:hypothetical protein